MPASFPKGYTVRALLHFVPLFGFHDTVGRVGGRRGHAVGQEEKKKKKPKTYYQEVRDQHETQTSSAIQ